MKSVEETVELMKAEIRADMDAGLVPFRCNSFSVLHDHVDANEYGGFCVDIQYEKMVAYFGGLDDGGMPQGMVDYINKCQNLVDAWLKDRTAYLASVVIS
jgi:hypothetical protein